MLEGLWWLQREGSLGNSWRMGGSLHSPQEEYQGTSTPKPQPCDVELCLRVSCQLQAGLVLGEATLHTESLKPPG